MDVGAATPSNPPEYEVKRKEKFVHRRGPVRRTQVLRIAVQRNEVLTSESHSWSLQAALAPFSRSGMPGRPSRLQRYRRCFSASLAVRMGGPWTRRDGISAATASASSFPNRLPNFTAARWRCSRRRAWGLLSPSSFPAIGPSPPRRRHDEQRRNWLAAGRTRNCRVDETTLSRLPNGQETRMRTDSRYTTKTSSSIPPSCSRLECVAPEQKRFWSPVDAVVLLVLCGHARRHRQRTLGSAAYFGGSCLTVRLRLHCVTGDVGYRASAITGFPRGVWKHPISDASLTGSGRRLTAYNFLVGQSAPRFAGQDWGLH